MTEGGFDAGPNLEAQMAQLETHLTTLKSFETDRIDPRVDEAKTLLRDFLSPHRPALAEYGLVPTIHGSMQYNDARNLDSDLAFLSDKKLSDDLYTKIIIDTVQKPLLDIWPTGPQNVEAAGWSVEELEESIAEHEDPFDEEIFAIDAAGYLLTSAPVFPEDKEKLTSLREKTKIILRAHPTFLQATLQELEGIIDIRRERRSTNP